VAYTQLGSFAGADPASTISSQYSIIVTPASGPPVTYNLFSVTLSEGGSASVTSDLNGNDASKTGHLISNELNGVLTVNGVEVDAAEATADLLKFCSPSTGWDLNPSNFAIDTFQPFNPSDVASVFNLSAAVFFDPSTLSASVSSMDESVAVAVVPEPRVWVMMLFGLGGLVLAGHRRHKISVDR
jgi:hypothetical protein